MTLLDLCRLIKRYLVLVIALPIVCALACGGYFAIKTNDASYTATSRVVANSQIAGVAGLASSTARQAVDTLKNSEDAKLAAYTITAKADNATMTVSITVTGADKDMCIEFANDVAMTTASNAKEFYAGNENPFDAQVEPAIAEEVKSGKSGSLKYVLVAFLAGLFVAICIVVIIDMVRRPVKSVEGVQDAVELPVLEILPATDAGERLLANVRFASKKDDLKTVAVVPVGDAALAEEACHTLVSAIEGEGGAAAIVSAQDKDAAADAAAPGFTAIKCDSFAKGMTGAYVARSADAVVLAVRQWSDSLTALETAVAELKLADTNLVGLVFAKEAKK